MNLVKRTSHKLMKEIETIESILDTQYINKPLDMNVINNIRNLDKHEYHLVVFLQNAYLAVANCTPYIIFLGTKRTIWNIKDEQALKFILGGPRYITFANNEFDFTNDNAITTYIYGHQLKIIYTDRNECDIDKIYYIVDNISNRILVTIVDSDSIYIDDMLALICKDYSYNIATYHNCHFIERTDLPKSILPIVNSCLVMLKLSE